MCTEKIRNIQVNTHTRKYIGNSCVTIKCKLKPNATKGYGENGSWVAF